MPRLHNREDFFKYLTASTAEKILESGKLLWSAPHLFNDPFDHQVTYSFPFTAEEAARQIVKVQEEFVFGINEPVMVEQKPLGMVSLLLRNRGVPKEEALIEFREGAKETVCRLDKYQENVNTALKEFLAHSRVFCMTETHKNVVMWSHYAEQHRGAVIKFVCFDAVDDNFLMARPINYTESFPNYVSVDDWVAQQFGLKVIDYSCLAFDLAYIKHKDWSYEREWRVHIPLLPSEPSGNGTSLFGKDPSVFGALFLGCRMPIATQERLIEIARRRYPHMEIYRGSQSKLSFALEFERIE